MTDIPRTTRAPLASAEGDGVTYRQTMPGMTASELTLYLPDDAGFVVITAELDHPAGTTTVHIELPPDLLRYLADDAIDMADRLEAADRQH